MSQNGRLPPTLEVPPRARVERGDLFLLALGLLSKAHMRQGGLIPPDLRSLSKVQMR